MIFSLECNLVWIIKRKIEHQVELLTNNNMGGPAL